MMDLANSTKNLRRMVYESGADQRQRVLDYLNVQRKNQPGLCDSVLKICGSEIRGHRCVLAVTFPNLAESLKQRGQPVTTIELQGLDPSAVEALVEYSYTSKLDIHPEGVGNVHFTAKSLGMKEIEIATEKFILDNILPLDWLGVRSFGEQNNCPKFMAAADKFIEENMEMIYHKKEFFQLPRLQVELAATHTNRQETFDPQTLCESAVSWVQKQIQEEVTSLRNILEQTHIIFMLPGGLFKECKPEDLDSTSELITTDAQKEYIRHNSIEQLAKTSTPSDDEGILVCENNNERKRSWLGEKEFRLIAAIQSAENGCAGVGIMGGMLVGISIFSAPLVSSTTSTSSESSGYDDWSLIAPMSRGRCSVGALAHSDKLYAIGGYDRGDCLQMVECYDPQTNEWMPIGQLTCQRGRFGVAILDDNFYAIGGSDGHKELNTGESYDAKSNTWRSIPSMKSCRSGFGMAVINGCIYAVGGFQGQTNWKSVEKFDPSTMEWSKVSPMSTERNNLCVDALHGKLYAVGGYNGWTCFNSVECYDPEDEHWSFIKPMKTSRRGAGCAAVNGQLYVIGGSDGTSFLSSVECYNPELCEWTVVASMNTARHNVGVAVMGDLIYVVGGFDGSSFLNTIECYDTTADKWTSFSHVQ